MVTGGAGFIGSHLVEALLERAATVQVIDDLSVGDRANLPLGHPRLALTVADVAANSRVVDPAIAAAGLVFHLAGPIGVPLAHSERYAVTAAILAGGLAVVEACRRYRRPLVVASSSEVYGPGGVAPLREDDPIAFGLAPRWGYAAAKFALEHLAVGLTEADGPPVWVVRLFNVVGPRQRPETGLCVAAFLEAARTGRPLTVHGDGSQQRGLLHVLDAVDGLLAIAGSDALAGSPVNLGNPQAVTIRELAELVISVTGRQVPIRFVPPETLFGPDFAATANRVPDIRRLQLATGWRPRRALRQVLQDAWLDLTRNEPVGQEGVTR